jgi:serine phosphatase RsbU (regulator of sigma subunit)
MAQFGNRIVKFTGILILLFSIMSIIQGIYELQVSFNKGQFGFTYKTEEVNDSFIISYVHKDSAAEDAGLKAGDKVTLINGEPIGSMRGKMTFGNAVAGSQLTFRIIRNGKELDIKMTRKMLPFILRFLSVLYQLILPLLMLAYVMVGIWGIFKHASFVTNLIALVCFFLGALVVTSGSIDTAATSPLSTYLYYYYIQEILGLLSMALVPGLWLYLFANFPQRATFLDKHRILWTLLIFAPPILLVSSILVVLSLKKHMILFSILYSILFGVYIFLGILLLSRGAKREQNVLKRRQYHLIGLGIRVGALALLIGYSTKIIYSYFLYTKAPYLEWVSLFIFLGCLVIGLILPFTFLNSFFKNKILETESALKRKLRHIAASFILFTFYMGFAFLIGSWLVARFQLTEPSLIIFIVLLLSLTFSPLHTRIMRWLEAKLYPEKIRYKIALQKMIKRISGFIEEKQVLESLHNWIAETMNIQPIYAITFDSIGAGGILNIPLKLQSPKSVLSRVKDGSNFYWDEIAEEAGDIIDDDEKNWAKQRGISISIPMISSGEAVGLLNIGKKKNQEDFTGDDLEIFKEAAFHTAVALQKIKLQMVHLEKKRMDKELEVAREIQERLVPRQIPPVKGLLVEGHYQPCLEVGGDYFDIIPLDEELTLLVIADVSGKGAGAALLMSNLQASLHMALSLSVPLQELVFKINNLVMDNSLSSQFITFFAGVWDYKSQSFKYINAGHNPPIIVTNDGLIKRLETTGIGFGLKRDQDYGIKEIPLDIGDSLYIYTDGIEDLFNHRIEAFGVERLIRCFHQNRHKEPSEVIADLFNRLEAFTEGQEASYRDDLTIIAAKRMPDS